MTDPGSRPDRPARQETVVPFARPPASPPPAGYDLTELRGREFLVAHSGGRVYLFPLEVLDRAGGLLRNDMAGLAGEGAGVDITPLFEPGHGAALDQAIAISCARLRAGAGGAPTGRADPVLRARGPNGGMSRHRHRWQNPGAEPHQAGVHQGIIG